MKNKNNNCEWKQSAFWKSWESNMIQKVWGNLPISLFCQPANNTLGQPVRSILPQLDQGSIHSLLR